MELTIDYYIYLATVLFCIGAIGVLIRRNIIQVFMCIELMLNAVNVLLVAASKYHNNQEGHVFVFFTMVVAAAEIAVGLGILVMIYRNLKTTDSQELERLKD